MHRFHVLATIVIVVALVLVACKKTPYEFVIATPCEWQVSSPASQGVDGAALKRASDWLLEQKPESASLLVARHGSLVFERYYGGADRRTAGNVKSITKSVLSAIVGIALAEGLISSVGDRVTEYLPERGASPRDTRVREIQIRHLLTMTAGLAWKENGRTTREWFASDDPDGYAFAQPFAASPGLRFEYSTALPQILSSIVSRRAGTSTREYAAQKLFAPLGIRCARWDERAGVTFGGSELYLAPRDLARFGEMYLERGRWNGRQVVPPEWVADSTAPKVEQYYGYLWWIRKVGERRVPCALGAFGQALCIVPDLHLVVVHTSRPAFGSDASAAPLEALERFIVPAVTASPSAPPTARS